MEYEALANSSGFVVSAYIAAFLPWTAIASTDFISSKWISVRRTRAAGYRNLIWTILPLAYVIFYSVVQGKAKDYKEMSAAAVAAVFAALIGVRTVWGLWQLHLFHSWASASIDALKAVGIEYSLLCLQQRRKQGTQAFAHMNSTQVADEILVSDSIIDNQIAHGDVQCFLKFGNITLLKSNDSDPKLTSRNPTLQTLHDILAAMLDPLLMVLPWMLIPAAAVVEFMLAVVGRSKASNLKMVPKEPVEVWVRWAATFAAQGLQKWMTDFEVAVDPNTAPDTGRKLAVERFHERGKYFGAQLLASAALQLWTEQVDEKGMSPMLWDVWDEDSDMSDGLVVKQELFLKAIKSGKCLPFGAPQLRTLETGNTGAENDANNSANNGYYSFDRYQDMLGEFVSELPVRSCSVRAMRKFDVNMLEWLTIVLYLGKCAAENFKITKSLQPECEPVPGENDPRSDSTNHLFRGEKDSKHHERNSKKEDTRRGMEAAKVLSSQLGMSRKISIVPSQNAQGLGILSQKGRLLPSIPILGAASTLVSANNRLVSKAGQLIDIWLSLVCGDQISFLVEKLNGDWRKMCLGRVEINGEVCAKHRNWSLREVHKQLEKRRLERRIAYKNGRRYQYLDQYATFMGYRMESVRTIFGRWLESGSGKSVDGLLGAAKVAMKNDVGLEVQLSDSMCSILKSFNCHQLLRRKGVQCRLIWELQNELEERLFSVSEWVGTGHVEKTGLATMILLLLSFPGLRLDLVESEEDFRVEHNGHWCAIDMSYFGGEKESYKWRRARTVQTRNKTGNKSSRICASLNIQVVCGPQEVSIQTTLDSSNKCTLKLLEREGSDFQWKYWRDSFQGRLEGFQEWQRDLGVPPVDVFLGKLDKDGTAFVEIDTALGSKVKILAEWPPFRPQFCRLELEGSNFLKQPTTVGQKDVEDRITNFGISNLPLQVVQPVSYDDVNEQVLRHSSLLVRNVVVKGEFETIGEVGMTSKGKCSKYTQEYLNEMEVSHRLMVHQIDALHFEKAEVLKECLAMLCGPQNEEVGVSEAIQLLCSFVGTMLSSTSLEVKLGRESEVEEVILPECEKLIGIYRDSERHLKGLLEILDTCLAIDPNKHRKTVTRLSQRMLSFSADIDSESALSKNIAVHMAFVERRKSVIVEDNSCKCRKNLRIPGCFDEGFSKENFRTCVNVLGIIVDRGWTNESDESEDLCGTNEELDICSTVFRRFKPSRLCLESYNSNGSNPRRVETWLAAVCDLGNLLMECSEERDGVPCDPNRAMSLYKKGIKKGSTRAMTKLGIVMAGDIEGIPADPRKAVDLFNRAIRDGNEIEAMNRLAMLLESGEEAIPADPPQAAHLYARAIQEGSSIPAMCNLARLLVDGADGVPADAKRAVKMCERAIREGNEVEAMNGLAILLERGAEGVAADPLRAVHLYERAIRMGPHIGAMCYLGDLLEKGADGVPVNAKRAFDLYERAIREGNSAEAMHRKAILLECGAKEVPANPREAVTFYEKAIQEGSNTAAMYNLADLFESGGDGVPVNAKRAVELYEQAIQEGNCADSMNRLALLLQHGAEQVAANPRKAVTLFENAIQTESHVFAMRNLGSLLENGANEVPVDFGRAAKLYERAIREGSDVVAMNNLALMLQHGKGIPVDTQRSKRLFERAVESGNAVSMFNLAYLLELGADDVPRNTPRAVELYEAAIEQGTIAMAMYRLSTILMLGEESVEVDVRQALRLLKRAMGVDMNVDYVLYLAAAVIIRRCEEEVETVKEMIRSALRSRRPAENLGVVQFLWEAFKYGRRACEQDGVLAGEFERYAEVFGIDLVAEEEDKDGL